MIIRDEIEANTLPGNGQKAKIQQKKYEKSKNLAKKKKKNRFLGYRESNADRHIPIRKKKMGSNMDLTDPHPTRHLVTPI